MDKGAKAPKDGTEGKKEGKSWNKREKSEKYWS